MKDVGILVVGPPRSFVDATLRNEVADLEGRLRFIMTGWALHPVFGGEPLHPDDRVIGSLALGRIHLHHLVEAEICVLLVFLVGAADASIAAGLVRYPAARVGPPLPLFVLGAADRPAAFAATLRLSGELRAMRRPHEAACAAVREDDARFYAFSESVERARDSVRRIERDVG